MTHVQGEAGYGTEHSLRHAGSPWRPVPGTVEGHRLAKEDEEVTCTRAEREEDAHGPNKETASTGESQMTRVRPEEQGLTRLSGSPPHCRGKTSRAVHVPGWELYDLQACYFLPRASLTKSRCAVRCIRHLAQYPVPSITLRD